MPAPVKKKRKAPPNPYWQPTDEKPKHTAPLAAPTDPVLANLLDTDDRDDKATTQLTIQMMRASCAFFAAEVLTGPPQAPYNGRFVVADHHAAWDELITTQLRLAVLAPRDHGKTFFFDFAYPIWKAVFQPNGKGYIFSATAPQAARILEDIKAEIESNPKLQWLLPKNPSGKWSSTAITLSNGHRIYARGYGTKVRGAHPDWIVVDDGLNDEDAYSEVVRKKNIDYFYTAITNMVVPGGQIVVVGTPFHGSDLYADLSKNKRYCFRKFPALDSSGKPLWPARYEAQDLIDKRTEIGSIRFTREFLCDPISDDMSLFPEKLFRGQDVEVMNVALGMPAKFWNQLGVTKRYIGVDFALSSSTSADYTAIFVLGLDSLGNRWVIDIQQHRGLSYSEQVSLINAVGRRYRPEVIYLEANQMQRIFGDELIRSTDLPIAKFYTTGQGSAKARRKKIPGGNTVSQNKNSLEGGVPALRVLLENRKFRIPRGDERSVDMTERWVQEMKAFTWADGKLQGVGAHDDLVMACWIADRAIRDTGFSFESEGEEEENAPLEQLLNESMGLDRHGKPVDPEPDDDEDDDDNEPSNGNGSSTKKHPHLESSTHFLESVRRFSSGEGELKQAESLPGGRVRAEEEQDDADDGGDDDGGADPFAVRATTRAAWAGLPGLRR